MRRTASRIARSVAMLVIVAGLMNGPSRSQTPTPCQANVSGSYQRTEDFDGGRNAVFVLEITTSAPCALVYFNVTTTERLFNGEEITTTTPMWRKVTDGEEPGYKVLYKMAQDTNLIDSRVEYDRCELCGH